MQIHRHMFKDTQKDMKTQTDRNMLIDTRTGTHANVQRPANIHSKIHKKDKVAHSEIQSRDIHIHPFIHLTGTF